MAGSFTFSLTPQLYPETVRRAGVKFTEPRATYTVSGEEFELQTESDNSIVFEDVTGKWTVEEYGVNLHYSISIKDPSVIFDEMGISDTTKLGIAPRLTSDSSRQRFVFKKRTLLLPNIRQPVVFDANVSVPAGRVRGDAKLEFVVFVISSLKPEEPMPGSVLGVIHTDLFSFSGDGSEFPIETVSSEEDFLWRLFIGYDDPRSDMFDQSVMLTLNEKNPKFRDLKLDSNPMDSSTFREIMSQVFFLIISDLRGDECFDDVVNGNNLEPGSLAEAVYYMILNFAHDYDNPVKLSREIHDMVNERSKVVQ